MSVNTKPKNLRQARKARGMSMNDIALRIGVTVGAVAHWERGRHIPAGPARHLLAQVFELPLETIASWFSERDAA